MPGPKPLAALWLIFCFTIVAAAAPPLTTIQDVLYKADGTRFNGVVTIEWCSFQAVDTSNIATQSLTVRITDGVLKLQLVPTTNASSGAYYNVHYTSDGKVRFSEQWGVPPSSATLRLRDVRIATQPAASTGSLTGVLISDVTGLTEELDLRPTKGPGFATSRAAIINASGALEAVTGNTSDCVKVDGTSGPCGTGSGGNATTFVDAEVPAGTVDGANVRFTLLSAPTPAGSLTLYLNGVLQKQGLDYTLNLSVISFVAGSAPQPGDVLLASYRAPTGVSPVTLAPVEVLCGNTGTVTSAQDLTLLGSCTIPAGMLAPGDRVETRFDFSHEGAASGFTAQVNWGGTIVLSRAADAAETILSGHVDSGISTLGAQTSTLSWGGSTALLASAVLATDSLANPLVISLRAALASGSSGSVTLRNFTVLRYPSR